jgi:hypothetical protein
MLYTREDGSMTTNETHHTGEADEAVDALQRAVLMIEEAYEHLDMAQMRKVRAMASHLMLMLEAE